MTPGTWPGWTPGASLAHLCKGPLNIATYSIYELLLHTQYMSSGPHGFREGDFLRFSHYKSMRANDPRGVASLGPRVLIGRIYVGNH